MCDKCNKKIHNKAKRAKHVREVKYTIESFATMNTDKHQYESSDQKNLTNQSITTDDL